MADKTIGDLTQATQLGDNDLFVLEQNGIAKKMLMSLWKDYISRNVVSASAIQLPAGSQPTAAFNAATGALALGIPKGDKGEPGASSAGYVSGILKGDGVGNVSAAVAGTDYPSFAQLNKKPDAVMGTMTIHVAKTGSDTTGDGSAAHPFLTIQHAVDLLPKCLQQWVNIAVHAGQYNENVTIVSFFGGGYLKLYGISGETVSIKTLEVVNCSTSMIYLENFSVFDEINAPYNYSIHLENLINVRMESISTTQSVSNQDIGAVYAREVAHFYMYGCTISNKQIALDIGGTIAYLNNTVTGSGNTVGIRCGSGYPYMGGFVQKGGASLGGTEVKEFGGQIW